jgi:hypothetical protein
LRLRRIPVATHVDGLEWKRAKWNGAGQRYYRAAGALAVRWSDALIADAAGIQEYYSDRFSVSADYIPHGAPILGDAGAERIAELGLTARGHHLVVVRFEPENHVNLAVDGYLRSAAGWPLIVVGAAPYADRYTAKINELAAADRRVRSARFRVGPATAESALRQRAAYIHGHSVGGTNPSLLRAMGAGTATAAFDVNLVPGCFGRYFTRPDRVRRAVRPGRGRSGGGSASRTRASASLVTSGGRCRGQVRETRALVER